MKKILSIIPILATSLFSSSITFAADIKGSPGCHISAVHSESYKIKFDWVVRHAQCHSLPPSYPARLKVCMGGGVNNVPAVCEEFEGTGTDGSVGSEASGSFQPGTLYDVKVYNRTRGNGWFEIADFDTATLSDENFSESSIENIVDLLKVKKVTLKWKYANPDSENLDRVFAVVTDTSNGRVTHTTLIDVDPEYPALNSDGVYDDVDTITVFHLWSDYSIQLKARHNDGTYYDIGGLLFP